MGIMSYWAAALWWASFATMGFAISVKGIMALARRPTALLKGARCQRSPVIATAISSEASGQMFKVVFLHNYRA